MTDATAITAQLGAAVHQNEATSRTGLLERLFARLFHGLVYAQIWEDPRVDMRALAIGPDDNLVCIASGGCNVLSYLTAKPASVIAVDLSPAHVALGKLKLAAAQHLPVHAAYADFFARADLARNIHNYDVFIAPHLDAETRRYWDARPLAGRRRIAMFRRNVYRFGLLGQFIRAVHLISWATRVDFAPLLAAQTLHEQKAFYDAKIAPLFDLKLVRYLARHRAALFGLGIPPAQYDKLAADGGGDVIPVLRERTRKLICDFPVQENYFLWQATRLAYAPNGVADAVPPYLAPENFETLKTHADRVTYLNRSLTDVLREAAAQSKQGYVLLDAQDWMSDAQLNDLWDEITRTAAPRARVIFRTGGAADILPGRVVPQVLGQWTYDKEASEAGFRADRSAIYGGFHVYRKTSAA